MDINTMVEIDGKQVEIKAKFTEEEATFIFEVGLATLLAQGAYPFINQRKVADGSVVTTGVGHG